MTLAQGALLGDIPIFQSPRSVNNKETGDKVAETLGEGKAALLKAHGSVLVAQDVLEATVMAVYLELNAERQVLAAPMGEVMSSRRRRLKPAVKVCPSAVCLRNAGIITSQSLA